MDAADDLAFTRERFVLPEGVIYLDGNSLGALPAATAGRLKTGIEHEWGTGLIRSWNQQNWVTLPAAIGDRIARLVAAPGEVIAADSTSINIFKLLAGLVRLAREGDPQRRTVLSERGNFPTDLYMAQGLRDLTGEVELKLVDEGELEDAVDRSIAAVLVTQVDYRTGRVHDMAALNAAARNAGTKVLWDLSHSAGALPVELNASGAELAVGCGYKYLNGGPGAPAYLYVRKDLQTQIRSPLAGWFGHARPFEFDTEYHPSTGIERLQCGTPSILALQALECGIATFDGVDPAKLRSKSLALSDLFWRLMEERCAGLDFRCVSPRAHALRGSQLSFSHQHAYPVMQALINRGVIGDFRQPDLLRFGFTPLYTSFADIWQAVDTLRDVMHSRAWQEARFQQRNKVT